MNKRKLYLLLIILAAACAICGLVLISQRPGSLADIESAMLSQLSESDDILFGEDAKGERISLYLHQMRSGSFSDAGANEYAAVFKPVGGQLAHQAGFDRTIVGVFRADTLELIASHVFEADSADIYFYGSDAGIEYVLYIGSVVNQSVHTQEAELLRVGLEGWESVDDVFDHFSKDVKYAVGEFGDVYVLSPSNELLATYAWDTAAQTFVDELTR